MNRLEKVAAGWMMVLLVLAHGGVVGAQDWITKGGTPNRRSVVTQPMGMLWSSSEWWRVDDIGQSATQPIVVGESIYHLAGNFLWRIRLDSPESSPQWAIVKKTKVNEDSRETSLSKGQVLVSSSTPTYSPESGMIYFGTAYGWVWAYDTKRDKLYSTEVTGCPIVTSPLVMRQDGRDLVIVGDKNVDCHPGPGGKTWVIWGLDSTTPQPQRRSFDLGGWVTASSVPGHDESSFIVGADGIPCFEQGRHVGNGKVMALEVDADGAGGYTLKRSQWQSTTCTSHGQAGSFAAANGIVYYTDVNGYLYARDVKSGQRPPNWPDRLNLPEKLGGTGAKGFTNTEPAIDPVTGALYVTLRNYVAPGDTTPDGRRLYLRGCNSDAPVAFCEETGAPGAVIAIDLATAEPKWSTRLPAKNTQSQDSINTAPLILHSRQTLLFGDVNGTVHGIDLASGNPRPFGTNSQCNTQSHINLLAEGEEPVRGKETWSQVAGVGTDPMVTPGTGAQNPLLLIGVNIKPPNSQEDDAWRYGRLVAIRASDPYNLAWNGGKLDLKEQTAQVSAQVTLSLTDQSLGQIRPLPVPIHWFVTDRQRVGGRAIEGSAILPPSLSPAAPTGVAATIELKPTDPDEGYLVGVIDAESLAGLRGPQDALIRGLMELAGWTKAPCPVVAATEVLVTPFGPNQGLAHADNYLFLEYRKQLPANVRIEVDAPGAAAWESGGSYAATFRIINDGEAEVTVPFRATARTAGGTTWSLGEARLTLKPGESATRTRSVSMVVCGESITVTGVVNPAPRTVEETNYADNQASATTVLGACDQSGSGTDGDSSVVIVPADCVPNPDPYSRQPCLNYPNLIIPGQ